MPIRNTTFTLPSPRSCLCLLIILLVSLVVFGPVTRFDYAAVDDKIHTEHNDRLYPFTKASLHFFWTKEYAEVFTPVTYMVWAAVAQLAAHPPRSETIEGLPLTINNPEYFDPRYFHAANLLIHLLNGVLVFYLLHLLVGQNLPSLLGSLFYAIHPLQVEPVAWITGLRDVLAANLMFLSMLVFLKLWKKNPRTLLFRSPHLPQYVLAIFLYGVSTLAKSSSLVEPILLLILGIFWFQRPWKLIAAELLPFFLLFTPLLATYGSLNSFHTRLYPALSLPNRLIIAGDSLGMYLRKLFWPGTQAFDYGRPPLYVLRENLFLVPVITTLAFLSILTLLAFKKSYYRILGALLLFVFGLLPTLGLTTFIFQRFSTIADRYVYIALFGPALALALIMASPNIKKLHLVFCSLFILALTAKSVVQVQYWRNDSVHFEHDYNANPRSSIAANNWANHLERLKRPALALKLYEEAALLSNEMNIWANVGAVAFQLGELEKSLKAYQITYQLSEDSAWAHNNLGVVYARMGDMKKAREHLEKAYNVAPGYETFVSNYDNFKKKTNLDRLILVRENL